MSTLPRTHQGTDALTQNQLSLLADALCIEVASDQWAQRHRDLSTQVIDLLIDRYPDCPRWASRAVDQLMVIAEGHN